MADGIEMDPGPINTGGHRYTAFKADFTAKLAAVHFRSAGVNIFNEVQALMGDVILNKLSLPATNIGDHHTNVTMMLNFYVKPGQAVDLRLDHATPAGWIIDPVWTALE